MQPAAGATVTTFLLALGAAIVLGTLLRLLAGGVRTIDRALDPTLVEAARSLHLTTLQRVRKITFPALLPGIFLGSGSAGRSRSS